MRHDCIGDDELDALFGSSTLDAAVLEFDFVPAGDSLRIRYVFASEDYNEHVETLVSTKGGRSW